MINKLEIVEDQQKKLQLCLGCQQFFGRPDQEDLCSKCFKEKNKTDLKPIAKEEIPKKEELLGEKEKKVEPIIDTTKCYKCARKTGIYGFKCKCNYNFCKSHRIPEEHECSFDFKEHGRKELEKTNVKVIGSKLEKI